MSSFIRNFNNLMGIMLLMLEDSYPNNRILASKSIETACKFDPQIYLQCQRRLLDMISDQNLLVRRTSIETLYNLTDLLVLNV